MVLDYFRGKVGLEIAGPSGVFRVGGGLPIYEVAACIDDFSYPRPVEWRGRVLIPGKTFQYNPEKPPGLQFIGDAVDLSKISSGTYHFVIASHVLEHIANPLKAISEWLRVLKRGGVLLLIVPHRDGTFDRKRPLTTLDHLIGDFKNNMGENDQTHIQEVKELMDKKVKQVWLDSCYAHRGLHHHVFDTKLIVEIFDYFNIEILSAAPVRPHSIIILGRKLARKQKANNQSFLSKRAKYKRTSPFATDRA